LQVTINGVTAHQLYYTVSSEGKSIIAASKLGIALNGFSNGSKPVSLILTDSHKVYNKYSIIGKRTFAVNQSNYNSQ
jgi:hypothetical protein